MIRILKQCVTAAQVFHALVPVFMTKRTKTRNKTLSQKHLASDRFAVNVNGVVRVPVKIGPKSYEGEFSLLDNSEAACLSGLEFFETDKCDPLFSPREVKLGSRNFLPLYHEHFLYGNDYVFGVSSTEALSFPPANQKVSLPTFPTENDPKSKSLRSSSRKTSLEQPKTVHTNCIF